ncbi:MAG: glycosyltransferase [Fulvivirga sp.]
MAAPEIKNPPLTSVIIPCYNHAHYLEKAINSVLNQSYPAVEVLVVNDGSNDHTEEIVAKYPEVVYIKKKNQGLSAARNTGLEKCKGEFIVFLDADDWLYPSALAINIAYLFRNENAAFVSGAYNEIFIKEMIIKEVKIEIKSNHYLHLLERNYIGMPAVVMYRRWALEEFPFDLSAPDNCGDYDLSLRISRKYPILHHTEKIAAYRIHCKNMSANAPLMLESVLKVLKRQKAKLNNRDEKAAYQRGASIWKKYYCSEIFNKIKSREIKLTPLLYYYLLRFEPKYIIKLFL